jgi:hypothetical protein
MSEDKKENIYISLQEATKYCNHSQEYLSLRARQGKLKSIKLRKKWMTTKEWLEDYLEKSKEYHSSLINGKNKLAVEEKFEKPQSFQNLPAKKIPALRFGFVAALVIVLILATGVFGKESFLNVFRKIPPFVQEFSQGFDRGVADSSLKLKIKSEKLTEDLSYYTHLVDMVGDIIVEEITKSFTQSFTGIAEGIKIFFSVEYQTADIGEAFKDYGQWIGTNLKSNYSAANEKLENTVSSLGINLETIPDKVFQKYQAINDLLKKQISLFSQQTKNLVLDFFSWFKKPEKVAVSPQQPKTEEIKNLQPEVEKPKQEEVKTKEISKVPQVQTIKEVLKEKTVTFLDQESVNRIKSLESRLGGYDQEIIGLQTDMNRRSSGFMVSPSVVQPVFQSPNIVYTVGGGADTDWTMNGTTMYANNTVTNVGIGTTTPGAALSVVGDIFGSGNITMLGNLSAATSSIVGDLTVAGNILPSANTTYNLGSASFQWANIYTATATVGNTVVINGESISATGTLAVSAGNALNITTNAASLWKTLSGDLTVQSAGNIYASSSDNLIFVTAGTERMKIASTTGYVGIGTASPSSTLSVYGTTTLMGGYVGIGTTTPGAALAVVGNIYGSGNITMLGTASAGTSTISGNILPSANTTYNLGSASFQWANIYTATATIGSITINSTNINSSGALNLTAASASLWKTTGDLTIQSVGNLTASSSNNLIFSAAGTERMRIASTTGYVGIGTASPSSTLSVYGTTTLTGGYVGIGTTSPAYLLHVWGSAAFGTSTTPTLFVDAGKGQVVIGGASATTTIYKLEVASGGATTALFGTAGTDNVVIGGGAGWLKAGGVDPPFTIIGQGKYATYGLSMTGIHEETTGVVQLTGGEYVIDFNELEKDSNLWLFYQITDFGENWRKLTVLLSAEGPGGVWYKKEPASNRLIIYSETASYVSYRLTAPRFDWKKWLNVREDGSVTGLVVNEVINNQYVQTASPDTQTIDSAGQKEESLFDDFVSKIKRALAFLGMFIENGIVKVQELFAERVITKEIQMIDKATGEIYCTWIEKGEWVKMKGECGQVSPLTGAAIEPQLNSSDIVIELPSNQATELESEEPAEEEVKPEPEPEPEPESSTTTNETATTTSQ